MKKLIGIAFGVLTAISSHATTQQISIFDMEPICEDSESCFRMGSVLDHGAFGIAARGRPETEYRFYLLASVKLYTKACNLESSNGCFSLGWMHDYGWGLPQDRAKAVELYGKACNWGNELGCKYHAKLSGK